MAAGRTTATMLRWGAVRTLVQPAARHGPTALTDLTPESWHVAQREFVDYVRGGALTGQVLKQLKQQDSPETHFGMAVNLYHHGLQSATRALRNGEDDEMVAMALLHDVCEHTVPSGHGPAAGLILGPYLSDEKRWILDNHEVFQGYYYYQHAGLDRHAREVHRGNPHFDACARFCELFDAPSFDPNYDTEPLETFEPIVQRVFARKPKAQGNCAFAHDEV